MVRRIQPRRPPWQGWRRNQRIVTQPQKHNGDDDAMLAADPNSNPCEIAGATAAQCPVCGGGGFEDIGDFEFGWWDAAGKEICRQEYVYRIVSCDVCGHVMADSAAIERDYGPDFIAKLYTLPQVPDRLGPEDENTARSLTEIIAYADLRQPLQERIVDFGCNDGALLTVARDRLGAPAEKLLGVDFAPKLNGIPAAAIDLDRLETLGPAPCDGFETGFCVHVLEHMINPRSFLRSLRRRAAPGAKLYLEVPDHAELKFSVAKNIDLLSAQHIHYFSLKTLTILAEGCGWSVLKAETCGVDSAPCARLLAVAAPIDGARASTIAVRSDFDAMWREAGEVLARAAQGPVRPALWGLGGDFIRIMKASPAFEAAVDGGRFVLADTALAGRSWRGQLILAAQALADDGAAPVYLTPRITKVCSTMLAAAEKLGIARERLRRPYTAPPND